MMFLGKGFPHPRWFTPGVSQNGRTFRVSELLQKLPRYTGFNRIFMAYHLVYSMDNPRDINDISIGFSIAF